MNNAIFSAITAQIVLRTRGGGSSKDEVSPYWFLVAIFGPFILLFGGILVFALIFPPEHTKYEVVKKEAVQVQLVGINPPKHFYVDIKETSGVIHKKVYVSKHYNAHRGLKLGTTFTAYKTTFKHRETGELKYSFDSGAIRAALDSSLYNTNP